MWKNFVKIFKKNKVDNVVWVMDYSFEIQYNPELAIRMWPDDEVVDWLFFNVFQFTELTGPNGRGHCANGLNKIY